MFRSVIVDDLESCISDLSLLLKQHPKIEIVGTFSNYEDALSAIPSLNPDLVFMDVELGNQSGFELVRALNFGENTSVIFVTAHEKYTLEALRLNAIDFLVKPVDGHELQKSLERFEERSATKSTFTSSLKNEILAEVQQLIGEKKKPQRLVINQLGKVVVLPFTSIQRVFSDGNYSEIFTKEAQKHVASFSIGELEELLPKADFFRIHRSFLVRIDAITEIKTGTNPEVVLTDKTQLPVARRRVSALLAALNTQ